MGHYNFVVAGMINIYTVVVVVDRGDFFVPPGEFLEFLARLVVAVVVPVNNQYNIFLLEECLVGIPK